MSLDLNKLHSAVTSIHEVDRDIKAMTEVKEFSASSTPPTTHTEHLAMSKEYRRTSVAGVPAHQEHGVAIDHKVPQADVVEEQPDLRWSRIRHQLREPFAEFFGMLIVIKIHNFSPLS